MNWKAIYQKGQGRRKSVLVSVSTNSLIRLPVLISWKETLSVYPHRAKKLHFKESVFKTPLNRVKRKINVPFSLQGAVDHQAESIEKFLCQRENEAEMLGNNVSSLSQKFGEEHRIREEKAQVR